MGNKTITYHHRFSSLPERCKDEWRELDYGQLDGQGLLDQPHSHVTHYGTGIFEGIRAKPSKPALDEGNLELAILNGELNVGRFFRSMETMGFVPPSSELVHRLPEDIIALLEPHNKDKDIFVPDDFNAKAVEKLIFELLSRNIKAGNINPQEGTIYIRPFMHRGSHPEGKLGVYSLEHDLIFGLMVLGWGKYLPSEMKLLVYPNGVEDPMRSTKTGANYALGAKAKNWAERFPVQGGYVKFHDVLFTDNQSKIQEATGANFFAFADDKTVVTPEKSKYFLPGITRDTAILLARGLGYTVIGKEVDLTELKKMPAAFLTGTATGIASIRLVYDTTRRVRYDFNPQFAPLLKLQTEFENLINGLPVSEANRDLQCRVRKMVLPQEYLK